VFFQWNSSHSVVFRIHISETPAASVKAFSSKVQRNSGYGWSSSWGSTGGRLRVLAAGTFGLLGDFRGNFEIMPNFLGVMILYDDLGMWKQWKH